jgi:hypothetical protein
MDLHVICLHSIVTLVQRLRTAVVLVLLLCQSLSFILLYMVLSITELFRDAFHVWASELSVLLMLGACRIVCLALIRCVNVVLNGFLLALKTFLVLLDHHLISNLNLLQSSFEVVDLIFLHVELTSDLFDLVLNCGIVGATVDGALNSWPLSRGCSTICCSRNTSSLGTRHTVGGWW